MRCRKSVHCSVSSAHVCASDSALSHHRACQPEPYCFKCNGSLATACTSDSHEWLAQEQVQDKRKLSSAQKCSAEPEVLVASRAVLSWPHTCSRHIPAQILRLPHPRQLQSFQRQAAAPSRGSDRRSVARTEAAVLKFSAAACRKRTASRLTPPSAASSPGHVEAESSPFVAW